MKKVINLAELRFIDLTHTLSPEVPQWGADCGFQHKIDMDYAVCPGEVKFRVNSFQMRAGTGTHMDSPAHCIPNAASIADIPLASLITECRMINVSAKADEWYKISEDDIQSFENDYGMIPKQSFIVLYTGWDRWWEQPDKYRNNLKFPSLSKEAAELLLSREIAGLGIDTLSPDTYDSGFPVHQIMLGAGKYIVENIANAAKLNPADDLIICLPIKLQDATEAPIRIIGLQPAG